MHRLKKTWLLVSKKRTVIYEEMTRLVSSDDNYRSLRECLEERAQKSPIIPWIGLYLRDITFLMDAHPTFLKDHPDLVNFSKIRLLAPTIKQIHEAQKRRYRLHNVLTIQKYLSADEGLLKTENDQFRMSLMLEPKE